MSVCERSRVKLDVHLPPTDLIQAPKPEPRPNGSSTRSGNIGVPRPTRQTRGKLSGVHQLASIRIWLRANGSTPAPRFSPRMTIFAQSAVSKQRRNLSHLDRPQIHRAVGEAQRERPRLLAFQHRFLAERVDAGGNTDIDVLLDDLAETGNRPVQCAKQIADVLGLDAR